MRKALLLVVFIAVVVPVYANPPVITFLDSQAGGPTSVGLAWDASISAAGYRMYYGNSSANYTTSVDVGNTRTYTFYNLSPGIYFFAVTAYDSSNVESGFSNEVTTSNVCGDVNGDGKANPLDIAYLIKIYLGLVPFFPRADINRDGLGYVDAGDVRFLVLIFAGSRSCP
jgi:hypothetical protein